MHAEVVEGDLLHLAIGGVVVDPVLVASEAVARMQHGNVAIGDHGKFVEPAAGQRAQPVEVGSHRRAQARLHVERHQVLKLAVDGIEVLAMDVGRDVVSAVRAFVHAAGSVGHCVGHSSLLWSVGRPLPAAGLPALGQDALDIGRHDPGGGTVDVFAKQRLIFGRFEIELDGVRAGPAADL